ncbi:hypothetical protein ARMSODRAFT_977224 [Armillaria solidipes]|uniref:Uncharacterized protein n=1 Tax=Armillaria solidipes TaxID=1076256 RepID=A0A2H3BS04_9AGAR|nr:hypothetical protein ARMSODRAFT_977224 [Armillaria solidipes]
MMALGYDIQISELPEHAEYPWFLSRLDEYMALHVDYKEDWLNGQATEFLMDYPEWEPAHEQDSAYMAFITRVFDQLAMEEQARRAAGGESKPSPDWPVMRTDTQRDSVEWGGLDDPAWAPGLPASCWGCDDAADTGPLENLASDLLATMPSQLLIARKPNPATGNSKRPPFVYTEEQNQHLRKKAVFHAKAQRSGSPIVLQRFLNAFFMEWFFLFPEKTELSGFELEAAQHFRKQDLLKMLRWAYWNTPFTADPSEASEARNAELDEARILRLGLEAQPRGILLLTAQIEAAAEEERARTDVDEAEEEEVAVVEMVDVADEVSPARTRICHSGAPPPTTRISDPARTATFYAALDALKDLREEQEVEGEVEDGEATVINFF